METLLAGLVRFTIGKTMYIGVGSGRFKVGTNGNIINQNEAFRLIDNAQKSGRNVKLGYALE